MFQIFPGISGLAASPGPALSVSAGTGAYLTLFEQPETAQVLADQSTTPMYRKNRIAER